MPTQVAQNKYRCNLCKRIYASHNEAKRCEDSGRITPTYRVGETYRFRNWGELQIFEVKVKFKKYPHPEDCGYYIFYRIRVKRKGPNEYRGKSFYWEDVSEEYLHSLIRSLTTDCRK